MHIDQGLVLFEFDPSSRRPPFHCSAKFTAKGPSYLVALDFQNRVTLAGAVKALRTVCTDLGYEKVGWITYSSWAKHDLVPPSTFKATYLNLKLKKARTCSSAQCNWVIGFECIPKGAKICNPDALGNYGSNNVGTGNFGNSNKGNGNVGNCNEGDRTWGANNQGARLFGYELKGNLQVSAAVFG